MVLTNNSSNKFGPTSFVVGTPANGLGNGVNYTSIQSAIDDAVAPNIIYIRSGAYVEDLVLKPGVSLYGVTNGGLFSNFVSITGSVTADASLGQFYSIANLSLNNPAGDTLQSINAGILRLDVRNCVIQSSAGNRAVFLNNTSGTLSASAFRDCNITGDAAGLDLNQHHFIEMEGCLINGLSGPGVQTSNTVRYVAENCRITGDAIAALNLNGFSATVNYCTLIGNSCLGVALSTSLNMTACNVNASDASGFWISGAGSVEYADVVNFSNIDIDPALTVTAADWKPYATTTGVIGTSTYDSNQFSVSTAAVVTLTGNNGTLPLFQALKSANTANFTGDGTNGQVIFDTSVVDQLANYNVGTGLFTAPVTGNYWFYATVAGLNFAAGHTTGYLIFYKNGLGGVEYVEYAVNPFAMRELTTGALNFWGHEIIPMSAGDTMQVNFLVAGGAKTVTLAGNPSPLITTRFGGWLIG